MEVLNINEVSKPTCEKCGCSNFSLQKREDGGCIYVECDVCGNVIGALENVNFNKWYDNTVENNSFLLKRINDIENHLKDIEKQNKYLIDNFEGLAMNIKSKLL